jgi:hypothetical protein
MLDGVCTLDTEQQFTRRDTRDRDWLSRYEVLNGADWVPTTLNVNEDR